MTLHRKAAVTGIGETKYSKGSGMSDRELQLQAVERAIADAGINRDEIDGIIPSPHGNGFTSEGFNEHLGLKRLAFSATVHFGGANGLTAMHAATMAVASGSARHVLVVAGRNGYSGTKISARPQLLQANFEATREFESPFGATVPMHFYALMAQRMMHLYGTTSRQLGMVAVTERAHALLNDNAIMQAPLSIEEHQQSRMLVDPLHLFDCCIESDGAAAYIVSAADAARDCRNTPTWVLGIAEGHPDSPSSIVTRSDTLRSGIGIAAPYALEMAGITPHDLQAAMLYDPFSFLVILQLEALGYCKTGEGGPFVESGGIALDGALPTNTHGGLLSQAHSVAGINHLCEAVRQLRGTAGKAQVDLSGPVVVTGNGDFGDGAVAVLSNS